MEIAPKPSLKAAEKIQTGFCSCSVVCTNPEKRAENREISPATLRNYIKVINLFCEMNDIVIT